MTTPTHLKDHTQEIQIRSFTDRDYGPVAELFKLHDLETVGSTNFSEEFLRSDWDMPNFDPLTDAAVAVGPDDIPVGIVACYAIRPIPTRPILWLYAHGEHRSEAIESLLDWGLACSRRVLDRVPDDARVVVETNVHHDLHDVTDAFRRTGFVSERMSYTMLIRFDEPTPEPEFPAGLRVFNFTEWPDVSVWAQTLKSSFSDHRGASEAPLSYYVERYDKEITREDFDPSVWWLVLDGETPAAICASFTESDEFPNTAYIHQLGTVPAYRRRGIAHALLLHAFKEHRIRGRSGVSLGVDGTSLTNAVAVYQRAGMHIAIQWDKYELELRSGIELTRQ